ncbi:pentapeptide repeat-containing protein [Planktothrix mougeotii]|uniref:Pentapeptide repeat-containing protein n=1 Tax=Planktothrix mougeotii LEGE 06226 TaxID=1828728 RepID=A0ABR9UJM2_9CYAN|nr:pentapeptide repeat-containing protein [Planktothrix mougeotii]MBE9145769.1 pentapeptide repeat-containing protein [Planktothrix mougeotii LEGE 06226]
MKVIAFVIKTGLILSFILGWTVPTEATNLKTIEQLVKTKACPSFLWQSCNLEGANLEGANLEGVNLETVILEGAVMPDGSIHE